MLGRVLLIVGHWYDLTQKMSTAKEGIKPWPAALEVDALTLGQ